MWIWVLPPLAGPSCDYVDVYAHLGDRFWINQFRAATWISEMDEASLRDSIEYIQQKARTPKDAYSIRRKKEFLPYLLKALEIKQTQREASACNVSDIRASYTLPERIRPLYVAKKLDNSRNRF